MACPFQGIDDQHTREVRPRPGQATIADVAKASKCSITTVSHVMNRVPGARVSDKTRQRVEESSKKLGYRPHRIGRALASRKSMMIGLVVNYSESLCFPLERSHMDITAGIQSVLGNEEYDLVLIHRHKAASWADGRGVDGAILLSITSNDEIEPFIMQGIPVVVMEPNAPMPVPTVGIDEAGAVYQAIDHLTKLGHRKIAFIGHRTHPSCMGLRTIAYHRIMNEHGLEPMNHLLFTEDPESLSNVLQLLPQTVKTQGITAILGITDGVAVRAMNSLQKAGVAVPDDVSLMGIDGNVTSQVSMPPLTTIYNPLLERGRRAAEMLLDHIRRQNLPTVHVNFATSLVCRESTAPPHAQD